MRILAGLLCLLFSGITAGQQATVTIYAPDGSKTKLKETATFGFAPGKEAYLGAIFEGDRKIAFFSGGHFLTFNVSPGKHVFSASDHQNKNVPKSEIEIKAEPGKAYFIRAAETHKGAYIVQSYQYSLTSVACDEARKEADTLKPLDIKKVGKDERNDLVGLAYFPSCPK